jgi:chemosensory pili system protein ChpB (putative protein-glutamate methylesterase)
MHELDEDGMSEQVQASVAPGVVLLFEDAQLSAHLREALVEAGARIVHEGPATRVTRDDLAGDGADVVVINLDDKVEEHLDALYELFDEERQRIVFNDAEASSGLSGWDQARWARHLAAKLVDALDVDPPRPAEGRPIEAHPTELLLPDEDMPEEPPVEDEPAPAAAEQGEADAERQSEDLTAELEALLAEDGDLLGRGDEGDAMSPGPDGGLELDEGDIGDADLEAIQAIPDGAAPHEPESETSAKAAATGMDEGTESHGADDPDKAFEETLRQFDRALAESEQTDADEAGQAAVDEAWNAAPEASSASDRDETPSHEPADETDPDKVASAPLQDRALESKGSPYSLVDPEDDRPLDDSAMETRTVKPPDAPDWDLVDFDLEQDDSDRVEIIQQNHAGEAVSDPTEFGIEKMSASDYLAPEGEDGGEAANVEPSFSLELEPLEKAVAPQIVGGDSQSSLMGTNLESGIRHAVVLAAGDSEESRKSLREFLSAIDRVPQAAFVAVVHQQSADDLKALIAELNAASPVLSVRAAPDTGKIRHGDLVLVPAGKQAALESSGRLQLLDASGQPLSSPSIDLTLTLVAQELGERVLAIILAGDAVDALAGAQAVVDGGGDVWALDPADCTDNTMVSVICEEQLARRTGTAQDLAARMLEELS